MVVLVYYVFFYLNCVHSQQPVPVDQYAHIQATIILTDPKLSASINDKFIRKDQRLDNGTYYDEALRRIQNGRKFASSLPFPVQEWWSIQCGPCPKLQREKKIANGKSRGNDRGVSLAHLQIWDNFLYEGRNGFNRTAHDVLVVFEDDAVSAVTDLKWSLDRELMNVDVDLLFLGWCKGSKGFPMCTHAYAATRSGIEKIRNGFDTCGTAIDGQFNAMYRKKMFTLRKAKKDSYNSLRPGFENYWTSGIIVQEKGIASFNYHAWNKDP
jgi:hypothetical protein